MYRNWEESRETKKKKAMVMISDVQIIVRVVAIRGY